VGRVKIDEYVLAAAHQGVRSIVLCHSLIYGQGHGTQKDSIQIPWLINLAKKRGVASHIGKGENIWSHVHIDDVVDLYVLAIECATAGSFFFVENGEATMKAVAESISRMLGMGGETASLSLDEAISEWGPEASHFASGSNSRVSATKARKMLGWNPKGASLFDEIEYGYYWSIVEQNC
jgi:nucleoside-diphosphate-sugar epimerase